MTPNSQIRSINFPNIRLPTSNPLELIRYSHQSAYYRNIFRLNPILSSNYRETCNTSSKFPVESLNKELHILFSIDEINKPDIEPENTHSVFHIVDNSATK